MNVEEMINMLTPVGPGFQGPEEAKVWFDGYVTLHPNDAYEVIAKLIAAESLMKAVDHLIDLGPVNFGETNWEAMIDAWAAYERAGTEEKG